MKDIDFPGKIKGICDNCPHYTPIARYVYELERDPKTKGCKYRGICVRVNKVTLQSNGQQMAMF